MRVNLKSDYKSFFKNYVRILNPVLKLRDREAEVLESLLRVYFINHSHPDIDKLLFSFRNLKEIRENLKISTASFNNIKMNLRRKGVITSTSINKLIINSDIISTIKKKRGINLEYRLVITNEASKGDK